MFKTIRSLLEGSSIISALSSLTDKTVSAAEHCLTGGFLTSYDELCEKQSTGIASGISHKFDGGKRLMCTLKRGCIRSFENSRILDFISRKLDGLIGCSLRYYGIMLLSFSIYVLIMAGVHSYIEEALDFVRLGTGGVCALISVLLMTSNTPISAAICESVILSKFLFGAIGIRKEYFEDIVPSQGKTIVAFIVGMVLGLFSFFISPALILLGCFMLIVMYTILIVPETGVLAIIFAAPFLGIIPHPSIISAAMVMYVSFCYFLKLIRGKRSIRFEPLDCAAAVFWIMTLLGGFFTVDVSASLSYAVIYSVLMLSYFLIANLMRTAEWIYRCVSAFISSSLIVSLYGIYQNYLGTASVKWQDTEMFEGMAGRVTSFFDNPNVLAEYLIMTIPFSAALLFISKKNGSRILSLLFCITGAGCLIYTMSRGAWLGFMIGMLIFLIVYSRKTVVILILGVFSIPLLPFVLPEAIIKRFTSIGNIADSSTAYRVHIWQGCIDLLSDFLWGGIGVGKDAFAIVYPSYTLAGIESAPHAHNLYLQTAIELGLPGLLVLIFIMILFARCAFSFFVQSAYSAKYDDTSKKLRLLGAAAFCGTIAVAAQGMTDYIWYNYRIFLIFWLLIGFTAAARRTYKSIEDSQSFQEM